MATVLTTCLTCTTSFLAQDMSGQDVPSGPGHFVPNCHRPIHKHKPFGTPSELRAKREAL
jgi:hypothetical protein